MLGSRRCGRRSLPVDGAALPPAFWPLSSAPSPGARAKSTEPEPTAAPAPNPQPPPATETEAATTGKNGPRPLMGLTPRPGASPELPKPPRDPAERRAWLDAQLDAVFRTPALAKAKVSAIVVEADSGKTLYAHDDKTPLNAASNVKIVTSAAALSLLGPEYRWRTTLSVVGPPGRPAAPRRRRGERRSLPARLRRSDAVDRGSRGDGQRSRRRWACTRSAGRWSSTTACSTAATCRPPTIRRTTRPPRARRRRPRRSTATSSASPSSPAPRPAPPRASSSIRRRPTSRSPGGSSPPPAARPRPASTPRRTATGRASTSRGGSSWAPTRARSTGGSRSRRCFSGRR